MKHGKHYVDAAKLVDSTKAYDVNEALELACKTASAKFDETVELHVRLGVDGRHADQQVRGAVVLPNGTGKTVRVLTEINNDKGTGEIKIGDTIWMARTIDGSVIPSGEPVIIQAVEGVKMMVVPQKTCLLYTSPSPRDTR